MRRQVQPEGVIGTRVAFVLVERRRAVGLAVRGARDGQALHRHLRHHRSRRSGKGEAGGASGPSPAATVRPRDVARGSRRAGVDVDARPAQQTRVQVRDRPA